MIPATLNYVEVRLQQIAEGTGWDPDFPADKALERVGFIRDGKLTEAGNDYYIARIVVRDDEATAKALSAVLTRDVTVNTFCASLWQYQKVPKSGAISLARRIDGTGDENMAELWLDLMNLAHLIDYEVTTYGAKYVLIRHNPNDFSSPGDDAQLERVRGHVLNPNTPYTDRLALKQMIAGARTSIRWYEQHMGPKVLELLHTELVGGYVSSVRLLSGPDNIDANAKAMFTRFKKEMQTERQVDAEWRVLGKSEAQTRHGRFFITEDYSRNLPPLNLILQGTRDEILPSDFKAAEFDHWWASGQEIATYQPPAKP